jgi:biotin transport system substrate-specific component
MPITSAFWRGFIASLIGGVIVVHAFGVAYLAFAARITLENAFLADIVFLPGDVLKAVVAGLVAKSYFTTRAKI